MNKLSFFQIAKMMFGLGVAINMAAPQLAVAAGDAALGEKIFAKCMVCHTNIAGVNKIGPSLHGVVGRNIATSAGYNYSQGLKDWGKDKKWDVATLDAWVANPRKIVANTKMSFPGLANETDRAHLMAYLQSLK